MKIEPRKELWKPTNRFRAYKDNKCEIWRVGNLDLEKELLKYRGGKSRWLKKK